MGPFDCALTNRRRDGNVWTLRGSLGELLLLLLRPEVVLVLDALLVLDTLLSLVLDRVLYIVLVLLKGLMWTKSAGTGRLVVLAELVVLVNDTA